jgi:hypothetical protein
MPWFLPMLAAAAGATVATKLQNKRDKKAYNAAQAQNEQRREDYYVNLRNDAQKGGFNPLTALRSGGGMGYSSLAGRLTQPLMTRNPLAAGISAASNAYTNYSMTRMNQAHDEKMTRLRGEINRANSLAMHSLTMSPDGKLPPRDQWWRYEREPDGSLKTDAGGYAIERVHLTSEPLTRKWRLGNFSYTGHNPEAFESGYGEMAASAKVHVGAGMPQGAMQYIDNLRISIGSPVTRNAPFENKEWSNEWRNVVNGALQ